MFCGNCGAKMEDGSVFCPECGTKVENVNVAPTTQVQKEKKPVNKKLLGIVVAVAAVILLAVIVISSMPKRINLNDYIEVTFKGYDTLGNARVDFSEEFIEDIYEIYGFEVEEFESWDDMEKVEELYEDMDILHESIDYELSKNEGLSNGDEITLTFDIDNKALKEIGIKVVAKDQTITVEGLEEVEVVDLFEGIEIVTEGISPYGSVYVNKNTNNDYQLGTSYECMVDGHVKNGDEIVVRASIYGDEDESVWVSYYGVVPETVEKTFTVEGLPEYVDAMAEISDEAMTNMKKQTEDAFRASAASRWEDEWSITSLEYQGAYFMIPKNTADGYGGDLGHNNLCLVYKVTAHVDTEKYGSSDFTYFYSTSFEDIMLLEDGTCEVDLSDYRTSSNSLKYDASHGEATWGLNYTFYGYENLENLKTDCVTSYIDEYTYESTLE